MIRRPSLDAVGQPAWLLITQTQHAGVAGMLAEAWDLGHLPPALRQDLLWAAAHHDDGWKAWEESPGLDGQGKPKSFLEISVEEVNSIWGRSIGLASAHSPLAGFLVARHFLELRAGSRAASHAAGQPAAQWFDRVYRADSQILLRQARHAVGPQLDEGMVGGLLRFLQLFDVLSLTLCCGPLAEPVEFDVPCGPPLMCLPESPWDLRFDPWPLTRPSLSLDLEVREVPQRVYRDAQDLKQSARPRPVRWVLRGGSGPIPPPLGLS